VALPAFARRTLLLQQSIDISCRRARSSKPEASILSLRAHIGTSGRTDRQTDGNLPFHKPCSAYYADSANKLKLTVAADGCKALVDLSA